MYDDIYLCVFVLPTGVLWIRIFIGKCGVLFDLYTASWIFYKKLPYYILSVQPIVAEDKTGFFTRLGCFLEEKIERGDKLEKI